MNAINSVVDVIILSRLARFHSKKKILNLKMKLKELKTKNDKLKHRIDSLKNDLTITQIQLSNAIVLSNLNEMLENQIKWNVSKNKIVNTIWLYDVMMSWCNDAMLTTWCHLNVDFKHSHATFVALSCNFCQLNRDN